MCVCISVCVDMSVYVCICMHVNVYVSLFHQLYSANRVSLTTGEAYVSISLLPPPFFNQSVTSKTLQILTHC